jgi:ribosomal protein S6
MPRAWRIQSRILSRGWNPSLKEGARVEQVQKMDKRQFSYQACALDAAYYVNFVFRAEPDLITKLRGKFKLDPEVYLQNYVRLPERKEQKEAGNPSGKKMAKAN